MVQMYCKRRNPGRLSAIGDSKGVYAMSHKSKDKYMCFAKECGDAE
jgi:hypothetical protein